MAGISLTKKSAGLNNVTTKREQQAFRYLHSISLRIKIRGLYLPICGVKILSIEQVSS
ncbi:hypothetical protein GY50_1065 [Dehalococcoides mccartyi GY50]|nr:hypothetical protein GY50_1065 [Dehalococcoides mccartyi GY50]